MVVVVHHQVSEVKVVVELWQLVNSRLDLVLLGKVETVVLVEDYLVIWEQQENHLEDNIIMLVVEVLVLGVVMVVQDKELVDLGVAETEFLIQSQVALDLMEQLEQRILVVLEEDQVVLVVILLTILD
tara:strand:- start:94 stop:477 length:384 start_codon:yes stop_codon:yes gene_type:complete